MPGEQVGPLVSELSRRIRDPNNMATSRTLIRRFLRHAEGILGVAGAWRESFVFTTERTRVFYGVYSEISGRIGRIITVRVDNRDIPNVPLPFQTYPAVNTRWLRQLGSRYEGWSQYGQDLLILWPGSPKTDSVTVVATAAPLLLPNSYVGDDLDITAIDTRFTPIMLDLTECLLLLSLRRLDGLKAPLERIKAFQAAGGFVQ